MDPLRKKLTEVDGNLSELRQTAGEKWTALESAKKAVAETDEQITPDHDLFKALDGAGKEYGEVADSIAAQESVKAGLIDALAATGQKVPDDVDVSDVQARGAQIPGGALSEVKSPGERIEESDAYKALVESGDLHSTSALGVKRLGEGMTRKELKALITGTSDTSAGAFVQPDRIGYFPIPLLPASVLDLITVGDTDSDLVEFVKQTSFTNAAAPVAEATDVTGVSGVKPQSDLALAIVQTGVKTLAHWVAATRRALADAGQMRTIVDGLLRYGLDKVVEAQVIAGSGAGENLRGILETSGTNAIPAGAQPHADKIHFGITQILLDGFDASGSLMNPLDWETIRLSRTEEGGAGTGEYLYGHPASQIAPTLWGRPVALSAAVPQGTAIVGDFRAYILWLREGAQILASDSHADFFVRNLIAVLAELRAAGGVPYPQAFAEVNLAAS